MDEYILQNMLVLGVIHIWRQLIGGAGLAKSDFRLVGANIW